MAGGDVATVFLETNLGTRITVSFPASSTTIADLKRRVSHEHAASFPQFGQISVQSIKVEHGGSGHQLADSMAVRDAFHGVNGAWRLHVDALPRPQHPDLTDVEGMVTERQSGGGANSDDSSADHYEPVSGRHGFEGSSSGSFVDANRLRDLQAFDDTKAGAKGLVDAGVRHVPAIFHHHPDALAPYAVSTRVAIPVIDLSGRRAEVVAAVKEAAETVGLFQVVKHGVPEAAMTGMLAAVRRFHEEPVEAKAPYYTRDADRVVRYNCNTDLFRSPAARWRDTLYLDEPDKAAAEDRLPRACRGVAPEYTRLMRRLGRSLFELLSEALGVRRGHLEEQAGCMEAVTIFAHYYPACPQPHLTLGAGRHSDPSFATVRLQDQVGGLQVLVEEEEGGPAWVDVPVVPGALVVTVGDFLQLVSNGRFHNVLHRVVAKDVGPRISVACFFRANDATVCTPVVVGSGRARYRTVTTEELLGSSRAQNRLRDLRI